MVLLLLGVVVGCARPPSDAALLAKFDDLEPELADLLHDVLTSPRMADLELALSMEGGLAAYGVSKEEADAYRQRLRAAGVLAIDDNHRFSRSQPVYFVTYEFYIARGVRKGFAWSSSAPKPIVHTLDGRDLREGQAFRHVRGEWYLFVEPE